MIFKVLRTHEWQEFQNNHEFSGSEHDQRDGFIHMATAEQLEHVTSKYFAGEKVYIVGFEQENFGDDLKWENDFPHLYNNSLKLKDMKGHYFYAGGDISAIDMSVFK